MSNIEWKVVKIQEVESRCVGLEVDDNLAPLSAFFFEARDFDYPDIIDAALKGVGRGFNASGVIFPGDLDEDEEPMDPDIVEVYDPMDSIRIPRTTFLQILHGVAEASLKERQKRAETPTDRDGKAAVDWELKMKEALVSIQAVLGRSRQDNT